MKWYDIKSFSRIKIGSTFPITHWPNGAFRSYILLHCAGCRSSLTSTAARSAIRFPHEDIILFFLCVSGFWNLKFMMFSPWSTQKRQRLPGQMESITSGPGGWKIGNFLATISPQECLTVIILRFFETANSKLSAWSVWEVDTKVGSWISTANSRI